MLRRWYVSEHSARSWSLTTQWIDYACSYIQSDWSWRGPLSIQCIGGLVLAIGSFVTPESPRYLVDTDQEVEGLAVIAYFQGASLDDEKVLQEYKEIRDAVLADVSAICTAVLKPQRAVGDRSYKALWRRYKARVMIAMSSQMFAQLVSRLLPYRFLLTLEWYQW